jgi:hypothetical protein
MYLPELFMSELEKIKYAAEKAAIDAVCQLIEQPSMMDMITEKQEPLMQKFVDEHPSFQFAYIVDLNGRKTTKNITNIADRAKYENYGVGTDQSDREWFIKPADRQNSCYRFLHFQIDRRIVFYCFRAYCE